MTKDVPSTIRYIYNKSATPKAQKILQNKLWKDSNKLKDQEVNWKFLPYRYEQVATLMKFQQCSTLNKTQTGTTPVAMPTWMWDIPHIHP